MFLSGNGLPKRLASHAAAGPTAPFRIAELGFGTGLNLMALCLAAPQARIRYTSFEVFPLATADIARALSAFPETGVVSQPLLAAWANGARSFTLGAIAVQIVIGDARETLPRWPGQADAWFLDGFSPAKNPELWSPDLMREVARHTAPGGSFATYSAAGPVRRGLAGAGFEVTRTRGFGSKRHMATGRLLP